MPEGELKGLEIKVRKTRGGGVGGGSRGRVHRRLRGRGNSGMTRSRPHAHLPRGGGGRSRDPMTGTDRR